MSLSTYLWLMRLSTLLALGVFLLVLFQVNPEESGIFGQVFFYGSLFLVLSGLFVLFFSWIRRKIIGEEQMMAHMSVSFRQGVLLALLANTLLFFQSYRVLTWWDGMLVAVALFLVELYFLSRPKRV